MIGRECVGGQVHSDALAWGRCRRVFLLQCGMLVDRSARCSVTCPTVNHLLNPDSSLRPAMLRQFSCNRAGRDIAVGDIHGCFGKLEVALRRIGFATETDRLFAVGDLVDRGPESHRVLEWLRYPWFHAVSGNHEQLTWRRALGDPVPDIDHVRHGGQWLDLLDVSEQRDVGRQLRALPLIMEVDTRLGPVGLVHADFPYDDWRVVHGEGFSAEDEETCLWSIARYRSQYHQPIRHVRAVVHGHLTLPRMTQLGNVLYIDTGGWRDDGHFTLLDLQTLKPAR